MGATQGKFEEEHMKEFEATTALNRAEIYHTFKIFQQLHESRVPKPDDKPLFLTDELYINIEAAVPIKHICEKLPALRVNPFRKRMCEIFSVTEGEMMTFVEFLDMTSAFSPKNNTQPKIFHAFQIFDDDGDGVISHEDMNTMLDKITDKGMSQKHKDIIIGTVLEEVHKDCNCDGLSIEDFRYAISRSPDFTSTFSFRL